MGLNDFVKKNSDRALPVFILADTSGSMTGEKITLLNKALQEMVAAFNNVDDIRGEFQVCIITFGDEVKVHQPLCAAKNAHFAELTASGRTNMGAAIERAISMINDHNVVPSTAYTPTIVLVSDGLPTDIREEDATSEGYKKWEPILHLHDTNNRVSKCVDLAMGIGEDADLDMLKAFINNDKIRVFRANEATGILSFFRWVTMSTISRMTSGNPDDLHSLYFPDEDTPTNLPL